MSIFSKLRFSFRRGAKYAKWLSVQRESIIVNQTDSRTKLTRKEVDHKLVDELCELFFSGDKESPSDRETILDETGDVIYVLHMKLFQHNISFEECLEFNLDKLISRKRLMKRPVPDETIDSLSKLLQAFISLETIETVNEFVENQMENCAVKRTPKLSKRNRRKRK
jgi:phosphoribosyl-ATP pyrophosphohydrolase